MGHEQLDSRMQGAISKMDIGRSSLKQTSKTQSFCKTCLPLMITSNKNYKNSICIQTYSNITRPSNLIFIQTNINQHKPKPKRQSLLLHVIFPFSKSLLAPTTWPAVAPEERPAPEQLLAVPVPSASVHRRSTAGGPRSRQTSERGPCPQQQNGVMMSFVVLFVWK